MNPAPLPESLGDFLIAAVLGHGGSGIVYDARWGPRRVALKVLHRDLVGTGKERAQFIAEAQTLQGIAHPSVVKVFAVGQLPDGRPFLAMEHLEGETLASMISRGPLTVEQALHLFGEMCNAVAALHAQGLVHRDLKPENVFIVGGRHAVLLDFGIAKELDAPASTTTQAGGVRGTPAYMAPERFFGQPASIATDLYELAVILYSMIAGRLPWDELADPEARLSPRALVDHAHVPEALDVEVRRALSTRAQNRPSSASALLHIIREAAIGGASTPEPLVTARMRSGPEDEQAIAGLPRSKDRRLPGAVPQLEPQPTPLAWAPTVAAPLTSKTRPRRWRYLAAGLVVACVAGTLTVVQLRRGAVRPVKTLIEHGSGSQAFAAHDPWGIDPVEPPVPKLPLAGALLTVQTYRAEAAAAIQRLPPDTRLIITVQVGELRAQGQTEHLLEHTASQPLFMMMARVYPPCIRALIASSEWVVYGARTIAAASHGTMVTRGRWERADVEKCFGETVAPQLLEDGARIFKLQGFGWIDFIDEHTAYLSNRTDLGGEAVHALVVHGAGPQARARDLVLGLPADRSLAVVSLGKPEDDWEAAWIPKGSDLYSWVRVQPDGLALDLAVDVHTEAAAKAGEAALRKQISDVLGTASPSVGKLEIVRDHTTVRLRGMMTSFMIGILDMAIGAL